MHIVHLGKYYPPERGGIERVVQGLCRGLVRSGQDVTVVASNSSAETVDDQLDGVRVIRVARQLLVRVQPVNLGLTRTLMGLNFDVLHVHTPNPLGSLAALAALRGRALVVTHHSDIVQQRMLGVAGKLAHQALYARAAAVVVATPPQLRYSSLLRQFEARCRVIPFAAPTRTLADRPVLPPLPEGWVGRPFALFVGRLVYYKGLDVLVEALARCSALRLVVVGSGPLDQELRARAEDRGVQGRVAFLGNVEDATLQALYSACRFLVLPSTASSEAFGFVQLEAMAAGRPVIATNLRSGVPHVNQHQRTGLIVPVGDANALAHAMQTLLDDEALCTRLGNAGRARALSEFAEDKVLGQWLELYSELTRAC